MTAPPEVDELRDQVMGLCGEIAALRQALRHLAWRARGDLIGVLELAQELERLAERGAR